ncbi:MAG: tRNA lysidine(34) synthetase TilS [Candidatus Zophobacter franzmannii]|jgi:tRNA(Ile)-lysidine synthase|nr:tRNA lysidine(34) synthetase TilS [Candidatus Zophobacter franzmannii]
MNYTENFLERFEQFALKEKLFKENDKILVGVSGGADSTALLLALYHMSAKYQLFLLVAHVNYHLRGEDSIEDEQFVKRLCFDRNIALVIKDNKLEPQPGLENIARKVRLGYFRHLKPKYKIENIALGHHKEDQAETVLMKTFRGAGFTGLKGIRPRSESVIHPLLPFTKDEIKQFLVDQDIEWREDKSNAENDFTRNKVRNELLPWIKENINPNIIEQMNIMGEIFASTDELLQETARHKFRQLKQIGRDYRTEFCINDLLKENKSLRYYVFRLAYSTYSETEKDFYYKNYLEIEDIMLSEASKYITLPNGVYVVKEYSRLIFTDDDPIFLPEETSRVIESIRSRFSFGDYIFSMKKLKMLPKGHPFLDKNAAYLDFDSFAFPLTVRYREDGDQFQPYGMKGEKKLKDFFIDEKVPKFDRDRIPIVTNGDKIIWVCGQRIDDKFKVRSDSKNIIMLKIERKSRIKQRSASRYGKEDI